MTDRKRKPILGIKCKPRHEYEADRLRSLADKHKAARREPQAQDG